MRVRRLVEKRLRAWTTWVLVAGLCLAARAGRPTAWTATAAAGGDQGTSISLSPLLVELTLQPGSKGSFDMLIANDGLGPPARFRVYTADVRQARDGDYDLADAGTTPRSAARWLKLSADSLTLGPRKAANVTAEVSVPRSARGGWYAAVVFELEPEGPPEPSEGMTVSSVYRYRMACMVEITVPERGARRQLSVTGLTVVPASEDQWLASRVGKQALMFAGTVKNESNVHVFVKGTLTLRGSDGKRLRQIPLGAGRGVVLPDATVDLVSVLPAGLPEGSYVADISVNYGGVRPAAARIPFEVSGAGAARQAGVQVVSTAGVEVQPEQAEVALVPGAVRTTTLVIINRNDEPVKVNARVAPLAFTPEGEVSEELAREDAWSCASWVTVTPRSFELKARGRQTVRVTVTAPKTEKPGGRYANLVFECSRLTGSGATRAGGAGPVSTKVGASLVATVGSGVTLTRSGSVSRPEVALASGGSLGNRFSVTFTNSGNIHVQVSGTFVLSKHVVPETTPGVEYAGGGDYVEVARVDAPGSEGLVLPGQPRVLSASLMRPLEPGHYRLDAIVNYGGAQPAHASAEFDVTT